MKICVFGAASDHIDKIYIQKVEELGEKMAKRGHSLVFGCGGTGVMGAVARGVKKGGGYIHGVVPSFFRDCGIEGLFEDCDMVTYTETMRERKAIMEDDADAFIVAPGGVGTLEELYEIITLKQLNRHDKAIVLFNIDDYYNSLQDFMVMSTERKFLTPHCLKLYEIFSDADKILDYLEAYVPNVIPFTQAKYDRK
jgi:hypothetical protein